MPRPYFQASTRDLEALFERHKDDPEQLAVLLDELNRRNAPKAISLKENVMRLLEGKAADADAPNVRSPLQKPDQPELPLDSASGAGSGSLIDRRANGDRSKDRVHEPAPKRETSRIRKPGRLKDVPDARPPFTSNKIDLKLSANASLIQRYIKSLEFLVADMRRKNSGMRMVTVTDGRKITVDTGGYGYQFVFDGDELLFEGAAIVAEVSGSSCDGQIASVAENRITISLKEDFGRDIEFCVLRIDNTSMIEALRKRLEEISKGEVTNFNSAMASAVINNAGDEQRIAALDPDKIRRLRPNQAEAVSGALSNEIFYLWGPPGTGKTFTLSRVSDLLFGAGKKTLICSNTNQAVDQVLYALCRELKPQHPAMEAGQIVRIGKIAFEDLDRDYHAYVTLDGIIERKSADLKLSKEELEREVERITAGAAQAELILDAFQRLDAIGRRVKENETEVNELTQQKDKHQAGIETSGKISKSFVRS